MSAFRYSYILSASFKRSPGFTLIEIMLVVVIIVVLAIIGILNFGGVRTTEDLRLETNKIVNILRDAENRSMSQENGMQWAVDFENPSDVGGYYYLYSISSSGATSSDTIVMLSSGIKFADPVTGSNTSVDFSPITGLPVNSATVKIAALNNSQSFSAITIEDNGSIQY